MPSPAAARLIELGFVDAVKNGVVRGSEMLFLRGKARADETRTPEVVLLPLRPPESSREWDVRDLLHASAAG